MTNHSPEKNRRIARRLAARRNSKVTCLRGTLGLGTNIAIKLLDVSGTGARIQVKSALKPGDEIELQLCGLGHRRPVKMPSRVVWCTESETGEFVIGAQFGKILEFRDVHELGGA